MGPSRDSNAGPLAYKLLRVKALSENHSQLDHPGLEDWVVHFCSFRGRADLHWMDWSGKTVICEGWEREEFAVITQEKYQLLC